MEDKKIQSMKDALSCQCCGKSSFVLIPVVNKMGKGRICPMCFFTVYSASLLDISGKTAFNEFELQQSLVASDSCGQAGKDAIDTV